jgi:hypothetical protein
MYNELSPRKGGYAHGREPGMGTGFIITPRERGSA